MASSAEPTRAAISPHPIHDRPRLRGSRPPGAVVYGPLASRRLGRSLGVNLTPPGCRVCNFNCVYCEVPRQPWGEPDGLWWPTPAGISEALATALRRCGSLDSITISGCGEPTLHPRFEAAVACVLAQARRVRPRVPVRILTNGSGAIRREVRRALDLLDERIVTIDAAAEQVDQPDARASLGSVLLGVTLLRDFSVQSCFVDGAVSNVADEAVREWADLLRELRPRRVQIYTISRKPAVGAVHPVSAAQLKDIARLLRRRTGIEARVFA